MNKQIKAIILPIFAEKIRGKNIRNAL